MSSALSVVVTLAFIVIVAVFVLKKYNSVYVFIMSGLAALLALSLLTGVSVMGDNSTGSLIIDVFAFAAETFKKNASGIGMTLMMVTGYAVYMSHIGASTKLAYIATKPLKKIKNPYIILSILFIIGTLLKMVITSHACLAMLLMAIAFPILTSLGISKLSAAVTIIMCGMVDWGPNDSSAVFAAEDIVGMPVMKYFLTYQGKLAVILILICAVLLPIYLRYMDKKDQSKLDGKEVKAPEPEDVNCPAIYAVLPVVPLVLITIFSFIPSIKLDVVTANLIGIIFVLILETIRRK